MINFENLFTNALVIMSNSLLSSLSTFAKKYIADLMKKTKFAIFSFPSITKAILPKVTIALAWKYFVDNQDNNHTALHQRRWRVV